MYEINRCINKAYKDSYYYKTRNECNQIIFLEIFKVNEGYFNVMFYITDKRKKGFQYKAITGKDGIKSLIWAKNCIKDFLKFAKRRFSGQRMEIYADDERRRKAYEYGLIPLGFEVAKNRYKNLYYRL